MLEGKISYLTLQSVKIYERFFKRFADFTAALVLVIFLLPLYIILYITIRLFMGKPVFFVQERPGRDEKIFHVIKFRSMNSAKDSFGNLLPDSERLTRLGIFIRKTSLDELPQLFNILRGEMSFIGPRPLRVEYLPYYTKEEKLRHSVRPGISGLAQVNGRNNITWDEKLALDVKYVKNISFIGDVRIALKTILDVLTSRDVQASNIEISLTEYRKDKR